MSELESFSNKTLSGADEEQEAIRPDCSLWKRWHLLLIIGLAVITIFFFSKFVISNYLNRPPELIYQDEDIMSVNEEDVPVGLIGDYKDNFYTFLVLGTDKDDYHTDTIMVISLDTFGSKVSIVSVPRDTQVDVPRNPKKINAAYAVGGVEKLKKEIKSILGFSPHYYIVVNLEAFEKLVDAVGGVEFDVPKDMNKDDPKQDLHIHLKKGRQILDGDKALQLVRYREYVNADMGRIEIQQHFLMALANKLLTVANIPKITEFIDIFQEYIETDLSLRDMQWFARKMMQLDTENNITAQTLPYNGFGDYRGHNYVYLAAEEVISMVNQTINPYTRDITIEDVNIIRLED